MSKLRLEIIGNLGGDAVVRDAGGMKAIGFSVAHSEKWTDKNGNKQERTTWINCTYWKQEGKTKIAEYLKKGTLVVVEGVPSVRGYKTNAGEIGASLELQVKDIRFLGGNNSQTTNASVPGVDTPPVPSPGKEDDLPF